MSDREIGPITLYITGRSMSRKVIVAPSRDFVNAHQDDEEYEDAELLTKKEAINLILEETSRGKWVRTVSIDGRGDTFHDKKAIKEWSETTDPFGGLQELSVMSGLEGGE
jgi:hypothetical protein